MIQSSLRGNKNAAANILIVASIPPNPGIFGPLTPESET